MAIFNSYVSLPEGTHRISWALVKIHRSIQSSNSIKAKFCRFTEVHRFLAAMPPKTRLQVHGFGDIDLDPCWFIVTLW